MELIFDSQFFVMYALKLINYGFLFLSLYMAEKLFSEMYMKKVYAEQIAPPALQTFLLLMLLIHAGFNLFVFVILTLLIILFKRPTNSFFINWYLVQTYLLDYIITTVLFTIVSVIIGVVMQKKRYFRYKTEGLRAIRAFKEIIQFTSMIIYAMPYFYFIA